jgi:adenosine deaminase
LDHARRNGVDLGVSRVGGLYAFDELPGFLAVHTRIARAVRTAADFEPITWAMLQSCAASGALHEAFLISPHAHDGGPSPCNGTASGPGSPRRGRMSV